MSPREMELLQVLADKVPDRFGFGKDANDEFFRDSAFGGISFYLGLPQGWIMTVLESLDFAYIEKEEGRTWQESILNAIVHRLTEDPRPVVKA